MILQSLFKNKKTVLLLFLFLILKSSPVFCLMGDDEKNIFSVGFKIGSDFSEQSTSALTGLELSLYGINDKYFWWGFLNRRNFSFR